MMLLSTINVMLYSILLFGYSTATSIKKGCTSGDISSLQVHCNSQASYLVLCTESTHAQIQLRLTYIKRVFHVTHDIGLPLEIYWNSGMHNKALVRIGFAPEQYTYVMTAQKMQLSVTSNASIHYILCDTPINQCNAVSDEDRHISNNTSEFAIDSSIEIYQPDLVGYEDEFICSEDFYVHYKSEHEYGSGEDFEDDLQYDHYKSKHDDGSRFEGYMDDLPYGFHKSKHEDGSGIEEYVDDLQYDNYKSKHEYGSGLDYYVDDLNYDHNKSMPDFGLKGEHVDFNSSDFHDSMNAIGFGGKYVDDDFLGFNESNHEFGFNKSMHENGTEDYGSGEGDIEDDEDFGHIESNPKNRMVEDYVVDNDFAHNESKHDNRTGGEYADDYYVSHNDSKPENGSGGENPHDKPNKEEGSGEQSHETTEYHHDKPNEEEGSGEQSHETTDANTPNYARDPQRRSSYKLLLAVLLGGVSLTLLLVCLLLSLIKCYYRRKRERGAKGEDKSLAVSEKEAVALMEKKSVGV